jgi:3-isopropylmalate dehydrogenase
MRLDILPGDGIGPEITAATVDVLRAVNTRLSLGLTFTTHTIGLESLDTHGTTLPTSVLGSCRDADGIVLGPVSHATYPPADEGGINPSAAIRIALDLYANIRPSRSRDGLPHYGRTPMDLVIVRENTEGFYADRNMFDGGGEFMPTPDVALAFRKITAKGSARVVKAAFELARTRRKRVTAVHKQNVLRMSDGLFLSESRKIAEQYKDVAYDEQLVDSMTALLIREPSRYDVIVATNMFGDILSDEAAELAGGLGPTGPTPCRSSSRRRCCLTGCRAGTGATALRGPHGSSATPSTSCSRLLTRALSTSAVRPVRARSRRC